MFAVLVVLVLVLRPPLLAPPGAPFSLTLSLELPHLVGRLVHLAFLPTLAFVLRWLRLGEVFQESKLEQVELKRQLVAALDAPVPAFVKGVATPRSKTTEPKELAKLASTVATASEGLKQRTPSKARNEVKECKTRGDVSIHHWRV